MKYLIYSTLLLALVARADDLLPEGTQAESSSEEIAAPVEESKPAEAKLAEPVPPASVVPSLALPVESPSVTTSTAVSVSTSTEVAPAEKMAQEPVDAAPAEEKAEATVEGPMETAAEAAPVSPVDVTAEQAVPPPVAAPQFNYGPSAEEGYGSVGLKNDGQFMEVGGDKKTEEAPADGDRKTSSLPEESTRQ